MIHINMFSQAESVKGQGVASAYRELINLLQEVFPNELYITINKWSSSDITHYHTINPTYYLSTFFKKKRGKTVGYVHFLPETLDGSIKLPSFIQKIVAKYVMSFYNRMDQLVVVNPLFGEELIQLGIDRNKVTYIPNFVSKESFFPLSMDEKLTFKQQLNIPSDQFVILGVGQIQKRKGFDDFITLAQQNPTIQFIWAGGFSFGKITDGYEKYQKIYNNPPKNVLFTGIIDREKLNYYYNIADIFFLPSYSELFPMSILEAFSTHTPVMVRDLPLYEAIIDGYYLKGSNVSEWQQLIQQLLADSSQLDYYQEQSQKASDYYSKERIAAIWLEFYQSLLTSSNSHNSK